MSASGCAQTAFVIEGAADKTSPMIRVFAAAVVMISGLNDLPTKWGLGAIATIACVIWCWLPLRRRLRELRRLWTVLNPFVIFFAWGLLSFVWHRPFMSGLQNLAVLLVFLGLILHCSEAPTPKPNCKFYTALGIAVWGASVLYAISLLVDGLGSEWILGARTFGLFALVGISWYVARWCSGVPKSLGPAIVLLLLIALSLSRMSFAIGIALFPFASVTVATKGKRLRIIAVAVLITAIVLTAVSQFSAFTERFEAEEGTRSAVDVGGHNLDTSGRLVMWALVWQSYLDSPWVGKGVGSAADLVENTLSGISHPHCDYLMLLHDYGIVGLMLFLLGLINLACWLWKDWRSSHTADLRGATFQLATLLFLIVIMASMVTDNCLSYANLMALLAVMVGVSLRTTPPCRVGLIPIPLPERTSHINVTGSALNDQC
jgi:O-antigen ligase